MVQQQDEATGLARQVQVVEAVPKVAEPVEVVYLQAVAVLALVVEVARDLRRMVPIERS